MTMIRKRVLPAIPIPLPNGHHDIIKNSKTIMMTRKGQSIWFWMTLVFGFVVLLRKPPSMDSSVVWTSQGALLLTFHRTKEEAPPQAKDPLFLLAQSREELSWFPPVTTIVTTGTAMTTTTTTAITNFTSEQQLSISLVWALDHRPDSKRFEQTLASLPPNQHLAIYCGSTSCLSAAQAAATAKYTGRVELRRISVPDLAQGTLLQDWAEYHVLAKLMAMQHYEHHLQAAMQLVILWKYGGLVMEPGYSIQDQSILSSLFEQKKDGVSLCADQTHGFSFLYSPAPRSKMVESLMKDLLDAYSWNLLAKLNAKTKDQDIPANPSHWPITMDWKDPIAKLSTTSIITTAAASNDDCRKSNGGKPFKDGGQNYYYGTLGYDDRRRQLMGKRIPTMNIGDETQGLAGIQMLPRVDAFVERDVLTQAKFATPTPTFNNATDKIVVFLNAWYGIPAMVWPPAKFLEPVTLAMHFQERMYHKILELETNTSVVVGSIVDGKPNQRTVQLSDGSQRNMTLAPYLQKFRPIGARDTKTLEYFVNHGIPAFFSACMTMTLGLPRSTNKDTILIIDAPNKEQLKAVVPWNILRKATTLTQDLVGPLAGTSISRYLYSFYRLLLYPRAKLIITARLHVALPAVALGTPVVFMHNDKLPGGGGHRLDGLDDFMHAVRGTEPPPYFDWANPPPNPLPKDFMKYRNRLKQMAVCHKGVSDAARKFGIVPLGWDAADEWKACSTSPSIVQDDDAIRIATTIDENYMDEVFPSWVNALARSNGSAKLELYILTIGLSEKHRCMVRTVVYNLLPTARVFTIPVDLSDFAARYFNKGPHISISTQSRLRLPSILPCIDKIAWIDLDAFVIQSLQEFWSHPVAPCGITARTDNVLYLNTVGLPGNTSWHDTYGYSFNAGVLLLSLETLRQSKFEETIVQHWAVALGFNDQVVLNMACNGTQGILNETMNMLMVPDFAKSRNPDKNWVTTLYYPPPQEWVIAHFVSSKKPWSKTKRKELPNFIRVWKDHKLSLADALAR